MRYWIIIVVAVLVSSCGTLNTSGYYGETATAYPHSYDLPTVRHYHHTPYYSPYNTNVNVYVVQPKVVKPAVKRTVRIPVRSYKPSNRGRSTSTVRHNTPSASRYGRTTNNPVRKRQ